MRTVGALTCCRRLKELGLPQRCLQIRPRKATEAEIGLVHSPGLIADVKKTSGETDAEKLRQHSSKCVVDGAAQTATLLYAFADL